MNLENFDWELGTGWEEPLWEILPVHKINTVSFSRPQIQPNMDWKYSNKIKFPESSKKQNFSLPYFATICIAFTLIPVISNLEMIYNKQEDVSRIYVNTYMQIQIHICANTFCVGTRYPRDGFWEQLCALFISSLSYLIWDLKWFII